MIKINFFRVVFFSLSVLFLFGACRKREDISLPDNYVSFTTDAQGINENEASIIVKMKLSRNTNKDVPVTINFTLVDLVYGTDFTTTPAAANGVLNITVPSGNNEASFTVSKVPGALFDGGEKIMFEINRSDAPLLIGTDKKFTLDFKELVATSSAARLDGGGATFPNRVFLDLSANRQTSVLRTNWDLGFYSEQNEFNVILNSSVGMMAKQIAKNDLTQVTAADTLGLSDIVAYSQFAPDVSQMAYVDYPDGNLSKTAIGAISATPAENKVFIVNRGTGIGIPGAARGWKKIRILRNATGGYTLQHADIGSATFTSVDIPKNAAYFFDYFSFDTGPATVEPEKAKWDIAWTYFGNVTNFGTGEVPYLFQDIVIQNRNVTAVRVMTSTKAYADFTQADLTGLTFSSLQNTIGADWRSGGGPTSAPAIRTDRYYIIKDPAGNYYKVKFTSLTDGGVRGYPSVEYALVKRA